MGAKVSVIIPVYNVEQYIERCARSLFEQTLDDIEYIFVNDCTPDKSMEVLAWVLDDYPARKGLVRIIDMPVNSGLPMVRKAGVEAATGDYIIHCDSDDWVEPEMINKMYLTVKEYNADAVICDYFIDTTPISSHISDETEVNCREHLLSSAIACKGLQSVCRFLVKLGICRSIEYWPTQPQGEDLTMVIQMAYSCKDIRYLHIPLYHWRVVENSMTHNSSEAAVAKRFNGMAENVRTVIRFLSDMNIAKEYDGNLVALKLETRFYLRPLLRKGKYIDEWKSSFPEINGKIIGNDYISFKHKIEYLFVKYLPTRILLFVYRMAQK